MKRSTKLALIIAVLALWAIAEVISAVLALRPAFAHPVPGNEAVTYPPYCCNSAATSPTGDCAPIDDKYVTEEADGYHINLPIGAHPKLKTKGYSEVIPFSDSKIIKKPIDNRYHICLSDNGGYRFCFIPKPGAV